MRSSQKSKRFLRSRILLVGYLSIFGFCVLTAQGDTEIYLLSLSKNGSSLSLGEAANISQNPGYDNQPYFPDDHQLVYARTRNGQTDIASLDLQSRQLTWQSDTPGGSEYSPATVPQQPAYSAVRLDTSGLQRLYTYSQDGSSRLLVPNEKIGYYLWINPSTLACTVLVAEGMDLVMAHLGEGRVWKYQKGVGRCLKPVPGRRRFSYTSREKEGWLIKTMDPESGATEQVAFLPEGSQDYCWLPDGSLLCGSGEQLLQMYPKEGSQWEIVHTFPEGFGPISRLAINESGTLLALVAESTTKR
jgi:hypothetical protein